MIVDQRYWGNNEEVTLVLRDPDETLIVPEAVERVGGIETFPRRERGMHVWRESRFYPWSRVVEVRAIPQSAASTA